MTNPATIAKGLTKAQRRAVRWDKFPRPTMQLRDHRTYSALQRRGLLDFTHVIAGRGEHTLTPLGLAVRAHLEQNT